MVTRKIAESDDIIIAYHKRIKAESALRQKFEDSTNQLNEILSQQKYSSIKKESGVKCNHGHEAAIANSQKDQVENESKCCPDHSFHNIADQQNWNKQQDRNMQKRTLSYGYPIKFNGYCHRCNNYGHKAINCKVRFPTKVNQSKYTFHIQCYNCHYYGHIARDCRMQGRLKVWKRKEQVGNTDAESMPKAR